MSEAKKYNPSEIESKWQKYWKENETYKTNDSDKEKFYILDMFPYPSGEGLHVGHPKGYIATDIYARHKRMQGFEVLHPMGFDAFGLPAEQYAIKNKLNPRVATEKNVATYKRQLEMLGLDYDWDREVNTTDPNFYKWTQWCFKQMYKAGLVSESYEPINWCPSCMTGLANEDVENGACERCSTLVEKKPIRQWSIRITDYADRLLADLDKLDWEPHIKELQRNWIGKSEGAEIDFEINNSDTSTTLLIDAIECLFDKDTSLNIELFNYLNNLDNNKIIVTNSDDYKELFKKLPDQKKWSIFSLKNSPSKKESKYFEVLLKEKNLDKNKLIYIDHLINNINSAKEVGITNFILYSDFNEISKKLNFKLNTLTVFTTRPDTLYGVTYLAVSAEKAQEWLDAGFQVSSDVQDFVRVTLTENSNVQKDYKTEVEKKGIDSGITAVNPVNGEQIPVWVANYVLSGYGTGAVMAVPAHDERDFEFAVKYNLKKRRVLSKTDFTVHDPHGLSSRDFTITQPDIGYDTYTLPGYLVNCDPEFVGLFSEEAKLKIVEKVGGRLKSQYKLRDWVFARQRYWGEPFPIVFDENRNHYTVADSELPVILPDVENYEPTGTGESPLAGIEEWVNVYGYINENNEFVSCDKGDGKARLFSRETNTMPQWAGSSWYYLRYIDPQNADSFIDKMKEKSWSGVLNEDSEPEPIVDFYVGGAEHATRHLIYARFWHKFLYDQGLVSHDEPFKKLQTVGLILAEDGRKMSKRWGNVVNPDDVIREYGADTLRLYEMFMGPFDGSAVWNTKNISGSKRFLDRIWRLQEKISDTAKVDEILFNNTVKKVTDDIKNFKLNTAISSMMILLNSIEETGISKKNYQFFLKLLAPFAPHITEELWAGLGNKDSIHLSVWPTHDPAKLDTDKVTITIQINGKLRGAIECVRFASEKEVVKLAKEEQNISKWLTDNDIVKSIYVPGKLVNFVLKPVK